MKSFISVLLILIAIVGPESDCHAQKKIMLVNNRTGRKLFITEKQRVIVFINGEIRGHVGTLNKIADDHLLIDGMEVSVVDIASIGRRRNGTGFQGLLYSAAAGAFIAIAIQNGNDSEYLCPSCQTVSNTGAGAAVAESLLISAAFVALEVNVLVKNSPRDVVRKWQMKIVD